LSRARRDRVGPRSPTLPMGLAPAIEHLGWTVDDFEYLDETRGRALFRSVTHRVFVRHDGRGRESRAVAEIDFASWAASAGLPVVAPDARLVSQPIVGEFGAVTFWPLLEPVAAVAVDPSWFGRTLRSLHDQRPLPALAQWQPRSWIAAGVEILRSIPGVDSGLATALAAAGDSATSDADAAAGRSPQSPIHGDASPDNVVRDDTRLLLTDFEKGSLGPAVYDLAPLQMLARRFGYETARVDEVLGAYGSRPDGEAEASFTRLFEVVVIAGAIAPYAAHAVFEDELRLRLSSFERPKREVRWTPHKELLAEVRKSESAG
jgi:hypothetical protein